MKKNTYNFALETPIVLKAFSFQGMKTKNGLYPNVTLPFIKLLVATDNFYLILPG
jgi:hypothetical protein